MLKKITNCSLLILSFLFMAHGMNHAAQFLKSPEVQELENVVGQAVSNSAVQDEAKNIFNEITHNTSSISTTTTTTTNSTLPTVPSILINGQEESKKSPVPNLDLGSFLSPTRATSTSIPKTPIHNARQLSHNVANAKRAQTERSARASSNGGSQDVVINMANMPKRNMLSQSSPPIQDNALIDDLAAMEKKYLPNEVWGFVAKANPVLHKFAQDHNLSLDDFLMFADLKNQFDVSPQAVVDQIKNKLPDDKKIADWKQREKYEKIKKNNPDKYEEIILEIFKDVLDQQDGQGKPSAFADTHIDLLEGQVAEDQNTKRNLWIAVAVKAVMLVAGLAGTLAWGAYGQAHTPSTAPTHAPTFAPTFAPV